MDKIKVLLVKVGEEPQVIEMKHTLETMQEIVGGLIQVVYPFEELVSIVCNDEGKMNGMEANRALKHGGEIYDVIYGDFFITGLGDEDLDSISDEDVKKFTEIFSIQNWINDILTLTFKK